MHAVQQMAQRNFYNRDIDDILNHGKSYFRAGAKWYVLRRRDVSHCDRRLSGVARLVGSIVCLERGVVSTVSRNDDPIRHIMRKKKDFRPKQSANFALRFETGTVAA